MTSAAFTPGEVNPARKVWPQRWAQVSKAAKPGQTVQLYLLLEPVLVSALFENLPASNAEPLFGFARTTREGKASPWLVHLGSSDKPLKKPQQEFLDQMLDLVQTTPCATLLASTCGLPVVLAHLRQAMDVKMAGPDASYLAFWDPAVLAFLMGQSDVDSNSRIEPVLNPQQRQALLGPLTHWWCWTRSGRLYEYAPEQGAARPAAGLPLTLSRSQTDALVQANVPDLLIYYINLNQPHLRDKLLPLPMHWFVRQQLVFARRLGLAGTRDLLNYVCLALMAGARVDQVPVVKPILARVKAGSLSFDKAMNELGEVLNDNEKNLEEPKVLVNEKGFPLTEMQLPL